KLALITYCPCGCVVGKVACPPLRASGVGVPPLPGNCGNPESPGEFGRVTSCPPGGLLSVICPPFTEKFTTPAGTCVVAPTTGGAAPAVPVTCWFAAGSAGEVLRTIWLTNGPLLLEALSTEPMSMCPLLVRASPRWSEAGELATSPASMAGLPSWGRCV